MMTKTRLELADTEASIRSLEEQLAAARLEESRCLRELRRLEQRRLMLEDIGVEQSE